MTFDEFGRANHPALSGWLVARAAKLVKYRYNFRRERTVGADFRLLIRLSIACSLRNTFQKTDAPPCESGCYSLRGGTERVM
jgi:hypothetical protein